MTLTDKADEPVKRKVGLKPARSRRCKSVILHGCHWETGKVWRVMMLEPEDLPVSIAYPTYE